MLADRNLFARMILLGQSRKLDIKDILSYHLGTLRKTDKSKLSRRLRNDLSPAETLPSDSACIIDGMAIVQKVMAGITNATFGEASKTIFSSILKEGRDNIRIDVVFDVYKENSIKNAERVQRGSGSAMTFGTIESGTG